MGKDKKRSGGPTERPPTTTYFKWSTHQTKSICSPEWHFLVMRTSGMCTSTTLQFSAWSQLLIELFVEDQLRANRADAMYAALGMPIKKPLGEGFRWSSLGCSPRWPQLKTRVPNVSTSHPRSHHLPRSPHGCQQGATKETPQTWGFALAFRRECLSFLDISFVASEPPQPPTLRTLRSSLGWTSWSLSLCSRPCTRPICTRRLLTNSSPSTPQELVPAGIGAQSVKINVAHCTTCPRSAVNTCAKTGGFNPLTPRSPTRGRRRPGALCLCRNPSSRSRSRLASTSIWRLKVPYRSCDTWSPKDAETADSRVALGPLSKGRSSSSRVNYLLKKVAALCVCFGEQPG